MGAIEFRALLAEEVECRVSQVTQNGVQLLLYKDSRCDMRLLDETVGPENWQCRYKLIGDRLFCEVGLRFKDGEWVWKEDVGVPSNMESTKGEASDAFKRACFKWGIGRELYTAPSIWVKREMCKRIKEGRNGKEQCYDEFYVSVMSVEDGRIVSLQICNRSNRGAVVYGPNQRRTPDDSDLQASKKRMWAAISRWAELNGREPMDVLKGVQKRPEWDETTDFFDAVSQEFEDDVAQRSEASDG